MFPFIRFDTLGYNIIIGFVFLTKVSQFLIGFISYLDLSRHIHLRILGEFILISLLIIPSKLYIGRPGIPYTCLKDSSK